MVGEPNYCRETRVSGRVVRAGLQYFTVYAQSRCREQLVAGGQGR